MRRVFFNDKMESAFKAKSAGKNTTILRGYSACRSMLTFLIRHFGKEYYLDRARCLKYIHDPLEKKIELF